MAKKYHRALDLMLASLRAYRLGKPETAGQLLIKAAEEPGVDEAVEDLDQEQEEARVRERAAARRRILSAETTDREDPPGDTDSLETLLDDVSEAAEEEELDNLEVEESEFFDQKDLDEEEDGEEPIVKASVFNLGYSGLFRYWVNVIHMGMFLIFIRNF